MGYSYDVDKLTELINDYAIITDVRITIVDPAGTTICQSTYKRAPFCRMMLSNPESEKTCHHSEVKSFCKRSPKGFTSASCHAGFTESSHPIVKDGEFIGYILSGPMRTKENIYDFADCLNYPVEDIEKLNEIYRQTPYYDDEKARAIGRIVSMLSTYIISNEYINTETSDFMRTVSKYIMVNLTKPLNADFICKKLNVSKTFLYNQFRIYKNKTVNEYINSKRITAAKYMLVNSNYPLSRVSDNVGISDYTYFSKLFKKLTGYTPLQYRKLFKE